MSIFLRRHRQKQRKKSAILAFAAFIRGYFCALSAKTGIDSAIFRLSIGGRLKAV
jgi:hypothetical protein